jgi:hypothetical protein
MSDMAPREHRYKLSGTTESGNKMKFNGLYSRGLMAGVSIVILLK